MKQIQLYQDTYAFEFDELIPYQTYVYTIVRADTVYVIDTFCGSDYMDVIREMFPHKTFIVINTHNDFDHMWGNSTFKDSLIYGHIEFMDMEKIETDRIKFSEHLRGKDEITLPNRLIDNCFFEKDGLEIIYTPGHSLDSISIVDYKNKCLYVGDNVELPNVQYEQKNISTFIATLNHYLEMDIDKVHGGHNLTLDKNDIKQNKIFLENIL